MSLTNVYTDAAVLVPSPNMSAHDWQKRLRSREFQKKFKKFLLDLLHELSEKKVAQLVDYKSIRKIVEEADGDLIDPDITTEWITLTLETVEKTLCLKNQSLANLVDPKLITSLENILSEGIVFSKHSEVFLARIMEQEFIRHLFIDLIHLSIVAFYKKVNPIFGGLTMQILEKQIKGFIGIFIPYVQKKATEFIIASHNQGIFLDFARSVLNMLLHEPFSHYVGMLSPSQKKKLAGLIREGVKDATLREATKHLTLTVVDSLYKAFEDKKIGDMISLKKQGGWLADKAANLLIPTLSLPVFCDFLAKEVELMKTRQL